MRCGCASVSARSGSALASGNDGAVNACRQGVCIVQWCGYGAEGAAGSWVAAACMDQLSRATASRGEAAMPLVLRFADRTSLKENRMLRIADLKFSFVLLKEEEMFSSIGEVRR